MRLSRKTFCYSILISLILVLFIIIYFVFMLPSLYVEYTSKNNLDSLIQVHEGYRETKSYQGLPVKNPTGSVSVEIPFEGNRIYMAGAAFQLTMEIKNQELLSMLDTLRDAIQNADNFDEATIPEIDFERIQELFQIESGGSFSELFSLKFNLSQEVEDMSEGNSKVHVISDTMIVFEGGVSDGYNSYTSYIAAETTEDGMIFSIFPASTPQMKEIRPIVMGSLPMIAAVVLLLVLIASQVFAKKIVNPIIQVAGYAEDVKNAGYAEIAPLEMDSKDEIGELGMILNELYEKLRQQYQELAEKNQALSKENKRQEVFLRASSHQLKTPITAALLLTEGMLSETGKYKDTKKYLPDVKKQLLSMRKIVEDILHLNHSALHMEPVLVSFNDLVCQTLEEHALAAAEKKLLFSYDEKEIHQITDIEIMKKILDNLISNAISYTPPQNIVTVQLSEKVLKIHNAGAQIDENILSNIYEPFVSSDTLQKGRGLGLYIVSYYTEVLGMQIEIRNESSGVLTCLYFEKKEHPIF